MEFHARAIFPKGFSCASRNCGLKPVDKDLSVFVSSVPAASATVFTRNRFPGAPVLGVMLGSGFTPEILAVLLAAEWSYLTWAKALGDQRPAQGAGVQELLEVGGGRAGALLEHHGHLPISGGRRCAHLVQFFQ